QLIVSHPQKVILSNVVQEQSDRKGELTEKDAVRVVDIPPDKSVLIRLNGVRMPYPQASQSIDQESGEGREGVGVIFLGEGFLPRGGLLGGSRRSYESLPQRREILSLDGPVRAEVANPPCQFAVRRVHGDLVGLVVAERDSLRPDPEEAAPAEGDRAEIVVGE